VGQLEDSGLVLLPSDRPALRLDLICYNLFWLYLSSGALLASFLVLLFLLGWCRFSSLLLVIALVAASNLVYEFQPLRQMCPTGTVTPGGREIVFGECLTYQAYSVIC